MRFQNHPARLVRAGPSAATAGRGPAPGRAALRPLQQVGRLDAEHLGQAIHDVDAGRIDAALERTDIGPVDAGTVRQFLLRQALRTTVGLLHRCEADAALTSRPDITAEGA